MYPARPSDHARREAGRATIGVGADFFEALSVMHPAAEEDRFLDLRGESDDPRRRFALEVVARLREKGFTALWAGGCVRDLIFGEVPTDYDVATDAAPEEVLKIFPRAVAVGISYGVVRALGPKDAGEVEIAAFRRDGDYLDGRRPESVSFGTAEEDASRRDFTINGMFLDPIDGRIIDFVGGRRDLSARLIRAIGDPFQRFREDKLRLLRAVRFAARFDFEIETETKNALAIMADQVVVVAPERIAQELRKMLTHRSRAKALALALETGLLAAVMPEVARMKGLFQGKPVRPDGDLWDHTLLALEHLPRDASFPLAFAALLHDVGKPSAKGLRDRKVTFYQHEIIGRGIAESIARRLRLSNLEKERICWLVENHQALGEATKLREARLKKLLATEGIDELLTLHRADALATDGDTSQVDYCERYLREQPQGPINPPDLITGHDLVRHGLKPGPLFSKILESVREAQLDRVVVSKKEALAWIDRRLAEGFWEAETH